MGEPIKTVGELAGICGRASGAWQKQPLIFGFSGTQSESVSETSTGATWTTATGATVPAGEIWVVQTVFASHNDPTSRRAQLKAYNGTGNIDIEKSESLAYLVAFKLQSPLVLEEGQYLLFTVKDVASGKVVVFDYWAYTMDIDL